VTPEQSALRFDDRLRRRMERHLRSFQRVAAGADQLRPAAVAVTIVGNDHGEACFLITRRAVRLRSHAGQWALPGGRIDGSETATEASLRELAEELELKLDQSSVLGMLDDYPTRSGYCVTPVVLWAGATAAVTPVPAEVQSVHVVPLATLEGPDVPRLVRIPESERIVIQVPLLGRLVHAPTAAVLYQLREVALHGRPTRVAQFEQPVFAWR